jgi:hypothetical protein
MQYHSTRRVYALYEFTKSKSSSQTTVDPGIGPLPNRIANSMFTQLAEVRRRGGKPDHHISVVVKTEATAHPAALQLHGLSYFTMQLMTIAH